MKTAVDFFKDCTNIVKELYPLTNQSEQLSAAVELVKAEITIACHTEAMQERVQLPDQPAS
jgi:hypothetical protein